MEEGAEAPSEDAQAAALASGIGAAMEEGAEAPSEVSGGGDVERS